MVCSILRITLQNHMANSRNIYSFLALFPSTVVCRQHHDQHIFFVVDVHHTIFENDA
jgi:hypothetical protein